MDMSQHQLPFYYLPHLYLLFQSTPWKKGVRKWTILLKQWQEVLVLYFFFRYTDKKIGKNYGRSRTTVNDWKLAALKQLRKEWARLEHEEQKSNTFWNHWKCGWRRTGSNIQCHMSLQELAIALSRKLDFTKVLSAKVRALAEEGDYNKSILSLWKYGKFHLQFYNQGTNFSV